MKYADLRKLAVCVGISFLPLVPGAWAGASATSDWYETLSKPPLTPPGYLFAIVWPVLYFLMGAALFLMWKTPAEQKRRAIAIGLFVTQLLLNALWTPLFFKWHLIGAALVEIVALWITIIGTVVAFGKISRGAAFLLIPYLAWVFFAIFLNAGFWVLNR